MKPTSGAVYHVHVRLNDKFIVTATRETAAQVLIFVRCLICSRNELQNEKLSSKVLRMTMFVFALLKTENLG